MDSRDQSPGLSIPVNQQIPTDHQHHHSQSPQKDASDNNNNVNNVNSVNNNNTNNSVNSTQVGSAVNLHLRNESPDLSQAATTATAAQALAQSSQQSPSQVQVQVGQQGLNNSINDSVDLTSGSPPSSSSQPSNQVPGIRKRTRAPGQKGKKRTKKYSKGGCLRCKRSHLKCDEVTPICGRCLKRGTECIFPDPEITNPLARNGRPSRHAVPGTGTMRFENVDWANSDALNSSVPAC
ncbi:unnamed protein product [Ambrosiozyma monospora]|uniref:Unnamed protein product n=1 Tax=Ambrosiozyma monospora TaxID=43982 RepID=A0A9W6T7L1_AMBMO|nr:unnamed protein product [Ambrosiozyma monospora]